MSGFNGSGTFNISGVGLPYVSGTTISSSVANQLNTDLATGLSTCITKDGQSTITANIGWNNFNINNLSALGIGTAAPLGQMEVKSGSTTNFIIDSSGNVGIGTNSPSYSLDLNGSAAAIRVAPSTGTNNALTRYVNTGGAFYVGLDGASAGLAGAYTANLWYAGNYAMAFATNDTERMRIDSSGNVGIGVVPSGGYKLQVFGGALLKGLNVTNGGGYNTANSATFDTNGSGIARFYSRGANSSTVGSYQWHNQSSDGSVDNTVMTIDSSGNVGIAFDAPEQKLHVRGGVRFDGAATLPAQTSGAMLFTYNYPNSRIFFGDGTGYSLAFSSRYSSVTTDRVIFADTGEVLIGYTSSNGGYRLQVNSQIFATSGTIATSDGRYKENVNTLENALDLVCALNPVSFDWKQHPVHNFDRSTTTTGFIAQEVQTALQNTAYVNAIVKTNTCVLEPEEKDADGNVTKPAVTEEFLGIAEGNLIAILTKAVQELKTELDTVKTELAALKGS